MSDINPRVLIEDWLPVAELGIESRRERAAIHALPPLSFLHIWWARRPLVASAAVVLGGLLPAWSDRIAAAFPEARQLKSETAYRQWLMHLVGIWGDPVRAQALADASRLSGIKTTTNPFSYKQAYRNDPSGADLDLLARVLEHTWGDSPIVLDPTAGGGSIPFTAARLGIATHANDLNPVAAAVLKAGIEIPARHGTAITDLIADWGAELVRRVNADIAPYFPTSPDEVVTNYLFANAIRCPRTGRLVPLLPDKWLRKDAGKEAAVRLVIERGGIQLAEPVFDVVTGASIDRADADRGTVKRGSAVSPYDDLVIDADYIKSEAQAGRMKQVLYAVVARRPNGDRFYRSPDDADLAGLQGAEDQLRSVRSEWERDQIIPTEGFPAPIKKHDIRPYGFLEWADFFTARQLLVHGTFVKKYHEIADEVQAALPPTVAEAVLVELALVQGKALNYNSRLSSWHVPKQTMRSVFERHDFSFKWTFAEMTGLDIYQWSLSQITKVYPAIATLVQGQATLAGERVPADVSVTQGSAADIATIADGTITHVCMDPPYYDNVMYAELADYFYVWEKHTLGRLLPDFFKEALTDKENEAVANPSRFEAMGRRRDELANLDYEAKMTAIFAESRRVLRDNGVLSVMFTHKRAEAWDTLGMGLLEAGFTIETSWPVNTEAESSLHQANVNSAASTIMLVCRKRGAEAGTRKTFLDDIEAEIRQAARDAVTRFQHDGIEGVDLLLSTYGPTLSVISKYWPVYSSTPDEDGRDRLLRPEEALDLARQEVVRLRRQRLVGKAAQIDNYTDFVLIAWDILGARSFPFDTARLLALAVGGIDLDDLVRARILEKKAGTVTLLDLKARVRRDTDSTLPGVRPDAEHFEYTIDAVDTVLYVAQQDGMAAAKRLLDRHRLIGDPKFESTVQGLINAMPRTKVKGAWVVPEAGLLQTLALAYLPGVVVPEDQLVTAVEEQGDLLAELGD